MSRKVIFSIAQHTYLVRYQVPNQVVANSEIYQWQYIRLRWYSREREAYVHTSGILSPSKSIRVKMSPL